MGAKRNLVICQKSKIEDWLNHFVINYPKCSVYDLTNKTSYERFFRPYDYEMSIGIINYDIVFRRPELAKLKDFTLLLDESSVIQNENSKRSKFILKKLHPANVILLSGSPTGGKYETLWSQLHLLGWGISKDLYWKQYIDYEYIDSEGFPIRVVKGYKNVERLKQKMRQYGCRFLKTDEVFELPEQTFIEEHVETTKEYRRFRKKGIVDVGETTLVGDTILKKMLYERQLCGQYNSEKIQAFQDLVQSTNDRLIVFYNFTGELNQLVEIAEKTGRRCSRIDGSVKDLTCYEKFEDSITFIQYQAGAMGLNLQKANKIVYFTPPLSSELFEQSKKRIHRIGQKSTCFYYELICKNSIEERIYKTLEMRRDFTDQLFVKE